MIIVSILLSHIFKLFLMINICFLYLSVDYRRARDSRFHRTVKHECGYLVVQKHRHQQTYHQTKCTKAYICIPRAVSFV